MKYIIGFCLIFLGCSYQTDKEIKNRSNDIFWDLSEIQFSDDRTFELHEGWKFYSNSLLFDRESIEHNPKEIAERCEYILNIKWTSVNQECNNHLISEEGVKIINNSFEYAEVTSYHNWGSSNSLSQQNVGTAVYRLDLVLPRGEYGLFQENWPLSSAGRLWILENQKKLKLLANVGYPSRTKEDTRPMWKGISSDFYFDGGDLSLILEVANFHHRSGYLGYALILSNKTINLRRTIFYHQEQMIIFGFIVMVGLYSFILFLLRTQQKELLWFSFLCFAIAFRVVLVSRIYQFYYPDTDSFEVLLKLEYLTFSFTPFLFVLFMKSLLKFQVNRILFLIALFYPIPISVIILFTGSYFFSGYLLEAIMSIFFCIIFVGYEIINKWKHEDRDCRYTIRTLSLVFFMFSLAILNDILISFGFYQWYELTGFGLILFIFGQAVIIAKNNSNAWRNTDKLNLDIIKLNSELDSKIEERTDELQKTVHSRMKDLSLAKEIQNNLLPSNQIFDKRVSIFSYYQAMDEVGGDIYDINQLGENTMRIFLADATGHGVQAGLITMLIKAEYDNLKIYSDNPNFILEELNRRYISKYKYLNRYFTCAILDINFDKKNIKFASAGHPSQLFFNSKNTEELHYTGPLMGFLPNAKFDLITKGMDSGSFFLLFSDGLFEQFNERNEILGEEKITDFFDGIVKGLSRFEDLPDFIANLIKNNKICVLIKTKEFYFFR